ncbi:antibiotic acetyltransferase [Latilactobacillus curvatus]|nr:antibiotic acetyltransferase [Latilactobacillus curvatus]
MLLTLKRDYTLRRLQKKWREQNKDNFTEIGNYIRFNIIDVGKYSYGKLNIFSWGAENEHITIGNFVSISEDVEFIFGNHRTDTLTTYPMKTMILEEGAEAIAKGPIIVEDDVWIGRGSRILSGVRIGQGAVIAAGSIVTKNVLPYEIVGGAPAIHIKYRVSDANIRKEMEKIDFSKLTKDFIKKNKSLFYETNIEAILSDSRIETLKRNGSNKC